MSEISIQAVWDHGMFQCRLQGFPDGTGLAVWADVMVLLHDPADALEVHDDIKLACKGHLDLLCTFLSLLEVVCFLNSFSKFFLTFFVLSTGFFAFLREVPVISETRGSGGAAQIGEHVLQLVLRDDLSDQVVLVFCAKL